MPYIIRPGRIRTMAVGVLAGALLSGAVPALASAACPPKPRSQPFAFVGDQAAYVLVPGGDFEAGAPGWALNGGEVIADNVTPLQLKHALALKPRGRAVSPAFCVTAEYPTFRFLLRRIKGAGKMNVGVSWTDALGTSHETIVDTLQAGAAWQASPVEQLASVLPLTAAASSIETVRLVFTATHPGLSFAIAGVYADPYSR